MGLRLAKNHLSNQGFSKVQLLINLGIIGLILVLAGLWVGSEKAKTRDAKRITDMVQVQTAFELLYQDKNSYQSAASGCNQVGLLVSQCNLEDYLNNISDLKDPGKFNYQVTKVPNQDEYEITFRLEKSYYSLKAGNHILSQNGIQ